MSSLEKMREAFEKIFPIPAFWIEWSESKKRYDCHVGLADRTCSAYNQMFEIWQSRQAEIDELSTQNQILIEVAESDTKTIERLESVINLNDSELKDKDKRIEMFLGVVEKHKRYIPHSTMEAFKNALGVCCD